MRYVLPVLGTGPERRSCWSCSRSPGRWAGGPGRMVGFSKEVGAFLAGVSMASTAYREAIGSR
jgi:hypothetical protein